VVTLLRTLLLVQNYIFLRRVAFSKKFSHLQVVRNGSGAQPAFRSMCTRGFFPGMNHSERDVDHSRPSSAEVKN